ncbi:unnamed protein product [Ambrosiozyma monospora]|uniref:Unnamed protein product n=1 Tax=Ambrosiozyma monospora TaxID=43982 RepID=A0ACB5TN23_AMBMO|nr:unnamed protein product [Ambrosiozyma monospora]
MAITSTSSSNTAPDQEQATTSNTFPEQREAYHHNKDENSNEFFVSSGLQAGLKNRMINLIALCGIIGPGCLIGIGSALAKGGPVGMLVGFTIVDSSLKVLEQLCPSFTLSFGSWL